MDYQIMMEIFEKELKEIESQMKYGFNNPDNYWEGQRDMLNKIIEWFEEHRND